MSKALLIVDIDEKHSNAIDELRADISINCYGEEIEHLKNQCLKPLPMKRDKHKGKIVVKSEEEAMNMKILMNQCCDIGFNACLEQILGEEE